MPKTPFSAPFTPDGEAFVRCIRREGTPARVHHIELFLDGEIHEALIRRYGIGDDIPETTPARHRHVAIALQRFLGYDYITRGCAGFNLSVNTLSTQDTAEMERANGRTFLDEKRGPISNWEEFEQYPWSTVDDFQTTELEWFNENLPDDMCLIGAGGFGNYLEYLTWLMGYETLCMALCTDRALVRTIIDRLDALFVAALERVLQFDRVKLIWAADDLGFRSATMISPDDLREFIFPGHKKLAAIAHAAGRPYMLHACGNLSQVMDDLIDDVGIDAKHSFEDTIEDIVETKRTYGDRVALLGGIDVDFLCRANEEAIRARVRKTLDECMDGGGYVLGSGNSVANYIPIDNYLAMVDEGRKYAL